MSEGHLAEETIQQYALDSSGCPPLVDGHLQNCGRCQAEVAAYKTLFASIAQQRAPALGFDVSGLVLSALPPTNPSVRSRAFPSLLWVAFAAVIAVPFYLFKDNIGYLFDGVSQFFLYACLAAAVGYVVLQVTRLVKRYHRQFDLISRSSLQHYSNRRV